MRGLFALVAKKTNKKMGVGEAKKKKRPAAAAAAGKQQTVKC